MITEKQLDKLNKDLRDLKVKHGVLKSDVADELRVSASQLSFYLRFGSIPKDRYFALLQIIQGYGFKDLLAAKPSKTKRK